MKNIAVSDSHITCELNNFNDEAQRLQCSVEKSVLNLNVSEYKNMLECPVHQCCEHDEHHGKSMLYIKNMVSIRCIAVVKSILENLELKYNMVKLGEVVLAGNISDYKRNLLKAVLLRFGFELMEDKKTELIEKTKKVIVELIHFDDEQPKIKFSDYLSKKINHNYTYLSHLFSAVQGTSIEHFAMSYKIKRVKELLVENVLTLSEIAWKLHYSSVAHLSNQFKKITGLSPSDFKRIKQYRRTMLKKA